MRQDEDDDLDGSTSLEMLEIRFAVRDVGRRAARGVSRQDILADYPDLRDQDIELAKSLVMVSGSHSELLRHPPGIDGPRFRRLRDDDHLKISELDRWVSANNIPDTFEYSKGWWDYIELVRRFAARLGTKDVRVIGHYIIDTPPPCERLPMPAVAIVLPRVTFALRFDFGAWSLKHREICEWVVSVDRRTPYIGPLFGLFDERGSSGAGDRWALSRLPVWDLQTESDAILVRGARRMGRGDTPADPIARGVTSLVASAVV